MPGSAAENRDDPVEAQVHHLLNLHSLIDGVGKHGEPGAMRVGYIDSMGTTARDPMASALSARASSTRLDGYVHGGLSTWIGRATERRGVAPWSSEPSRD